MLNSGWIQTEDALKDPEDALQSGQGKIMTLRAGRFFGQDLHQVPPPQVPQGLFQYQEILDRNIMELAGINLVWVFSFELWEVVRIVIVLIFVKADTFWTCNISMR